MDWISELDKIRIQLDRMRHEISEENFMIHVQGNQPEQYTSKVELLKKDLDNKDDLQPLDCMVVELDTKYKKICKKNNFDLENKDENETM